MNNALLKKLLIISIITLTISSCSKKENNNDFDLSNFKPRIRKSEIVKEKSKKNNGTKLVKKLLPLKKRDEISSSIKYGKKDPFNFENNNNNSLSNLIFKGFISTSNEIFALINYLGEEGAITTSSIGGINTKYLPDGAKVKNFNFSRSEITISLEDQEFIISIKD